MGRHSKIEWCDATWNPWRGCTKVSAGCLNCYAETRAGWCGEDFSQLLRSKTTFEDPLKWKDPLLIFVCSLSDFFHEDVPTAWRRDAWKIMYETPQHTYLLLTKRPENIQPMLPIGWASGGWSNVYGHVWLGVTAEDQEMADLRIPKLLQIRSTKHFVSAEPMLGPIVMDKIPMPYEQIHGRLGWMIAGGESGPDPRPPETKWLLDLRNECIYMKIPFFFKQWGGTLKSPNGTWGGRVLEGRTYLEMPER